MIVSGFLGARDGLVGNRGFAYAGAEAAADRSRNVGTQSQPGGRWARVALPRARTCIPLGQAGGRGQGSPGWWWLRQQTTEKEIRLWDFV
ncbi:hypothetical protein GCM10027028_33080 [Streptomyces sundarbansensis]